MSSRFYIFCEFLSRADQRGEKCFCNSAVANMLDRIARKRYCWNFGKISVFDLCVRAKLRNQAVWAFKSDRRKNLLLKILVHFRYICDGVY
jgi:hypothetical protein